MPRTRKRLTVFLTLGALTIGTASAVATLPDAPEPNLINKELVEAARSAYEIHQALYQHSAGPAPEDLYVWSKRWMAAERDLDPVPGNPVPGEATKAVKAHIERMEELEASTKARHEAARASGGEVAAAKFYVTEAKLMLARTGD